MSLAHDHQPPFSNMVNIIWNFIVLYTPPRVNKKKDFISPKYSTETAGVSGVYLLEIYKTQFINNPSSSIRIETKDHESYNGP
jgi:hypothetical protein